MKRRFWVLGTDGLGGKQDDGCNLVRWCAIHFGAFFVFLNNKIYSIDIVARKLWHNLATSDIKNYVYIFNWFDIVNRFTKKTNDTTHKERKKESTDTLPACVLLHSYVAIISYLKCGSISRFSTSYFFQTIPILLYYYKFNYVRGMKYILYHKNVLTKSFFKI
jgi:hypothetical protein